MVLLGAFGTLNCLGLLALFHGAKTYWEPTGDVFYVAASIEKVMAGMPFADFAMSGLPQFYPPLYFWLVGAVGALLHLGPFVAVRVGEALALCAAPFLTYAVLRSGVADETAAIGASVGATLLLDTGTLLVKPMDWLAAILMLGWAVQVVRATDSDSWGRGALWGIVLGLSCLSYDLWTVCAVWVPFIFAVTSAASWRVRGRRVAIVAVSCAVAAAVASPWWGPEATAVLRDGFHSFQQLWFLPGFANLFGYGSPFAWGALGADAAMLGLLGGLFLLRNRPVQVILASAAAVMLYGVGIYPSLVTGGHGYLNVRWQEFVLVAAGVLLGLVAAAVFREVRLRWPWQTIPAATAAILCTGLFVVPGRRAETIQGAPQYQQAFAAPGYPTGLTGALASIPGAYRVTWLEGTSGGILQQSPIRVWLPYNVYYANPAGQPMQRLRALQREAKLATDAASFAQWLRENPFRPIQGVIASATPGGYEVQNMLVPQFPQGGKWVDVVVPAKDLAAPAFRVAWQGGGVTVFLVAQKPHAT